MFGEVLGVAIHAGQQAGLERVHPVQPQKVEPWNRRSTVARARQDRQAAANARLNARQPWWVRHGPLLDHTLGEKARRSAEFLGEPYEKSVGSADVAEPIRVFVLDHFAADKLRAVLTEPGERLVDVVHGEHHA